MTELEELSKIGFGCYRLRRDAIHYAALERALMQGCNLIDTATTYTGGESEIAIGQVLSRFDGEKPFVITKAGYVGNEDLAAFQARGPLAGAARQLIRLDESNGHCLHPDYLRRQLQASSSRLGLRSIDGFLLHNPERSRSIGNDEQYHDLLTKAFMFLEDQVALGKIRFYGVSSNTLAADPRELQRLVGIADSICSDHHFRLLQFPLNLVEMDAAGSLMGLARQHRLRTFINRPLNARHNGQLLRIATYENLLQDFDMATACARMKVLHDHLCRKLADQGIERSGLIGHIEQFLQNGWRAARDADAVVQFYDAYVVPLVEDLHAGPLHDQVRDALDDCRDIARLTTLANLTGDALALRQSLEAKGAVSPDDRRPLAVIACEKYIQVGAQHVLLGMKKPHYVDQMKPFFVH